MAERRTEERRRARKIEEARTVSPSKGKRPSVSRPFETTAGRGTKRSRESIDAAIKRARATAADLGEVLTESDVAKLKRQRVGRADLGEGSTPSERAREKREKATFADIGEPPSPAERVKLKRRAARKEFAPLPTEQPETGPRVDLGPIQEKAPITREEAQARIRAVAPEVPTSRLVDIRSAKTPSLPTSFQPMVVAPEDLPPVTRQAAILTAQRRINKLIDSLLPDFEVSAEARRKISILVPTLGVGAGAEQNATITEKIKRILEAEKTKVEVGAKIIAAGAESVRERAREKALEKEKDLPAPLGEIAKFITMAGVGSFILAPAYQAMITASLVQTTWSKDKVKHLKDVGTSIVDYFKSVPAMVALDPALGLGELTGVFILGPEGALRIVRTSAAKVSPFYIPKRGMSIEYSVSRVPASELGKAKTTAAVNKGIEAALKDPKGEAQVPIGTGHLALKIRSTPVSETIGGSLYHATPDLPAPLREGIVKGELFTSPQLAPRFADSSATGIPKGKPAILMIFTKDKGVQWHPTYNLYKGTKEIEAVYPGGTRLDRVKTLQSRLLSTRVGDFITAHDGGVIPIFRFAEKGATVPVLGLAQLAAIRIKTIKATLADLVSRKKGFEILKDEPLQVTTRRITDKAETAIRKGKQKDKAIDTAMRDELREIYSRDPRGFERIYRRNPERFEGRYLEHLGRSLTRPERPPERPPRRPPERERLRKRQQREERLRKRQQREERLRKRQRRKDIMRERQRREDIIREGLKEEEFRKERLTMEEFRKERLTMEEFRKERLTIEELLKLRGPPRSRKTDKENRNQIIKAGGAVAWRQGEVDKKPVYHVVMSPYKSERDYVTVIGRVPAGAAVAKGKGSAFRTIRLLIGKAPSKTVRLDMGIQDVAISPKGRGVTIGFTPDPLQETTGDITIRRRPPRLSDRGKMRITPPRPRLRK